MPARSKWSAVSSDYEDAWMAHVFGPQYAIDLEIYYCPINVFIPQSTEIADQWIQVCRS